MPRDRKGKDLYEFVEKRLGPLMILCLFVFVRDWDKARLYALSPDECHELAGPAANVMSRFERLFDIPDWIHEALVSSDDTITILYVLVGYLERTGILDKIIHFQLPKGKPNVDPGNIEGVSNDQQNGYQFAGQIAGLQHLADQ